MLPRRAPLAAKLLGALLVAYLAFPVAAFLVRVLTGSDEGWSDPGLWSAVGVSVEGATVSLAIGLLVGVPLAYVLAHRRGFISTVCGLIVQLPLAMPPLMSGILLIYIVGPYTFLGRISGQRLTQTIWGVILAQSFVSVPFLVVVARSAFRAVDASLAEVAATLGHGPTSRFLRVEVPAAADGLRAGMVLLWLRAFGEYGAVVVLAYHPYSLPVYVENLFSSAPLSQTEAPAAVALLIAGLIVGLGQARWPRLGFRRRHGSAAPEPVAPPVSLGKSVGFALDFKAGAFRLRATHAEGARRLAILGPSGAGKSMTLRAIAGLLGPEAGAVTFSGVDVTGVQPEHRSLGYVPQGAALLPGRTVWQQVNFGVGADPARAVWWLRKLQLDGFHDRLPGQLSGGQRQRVALARALATDPQVVLLDEPFSALDAPVRNELCRDLRLLQRESNLSMVIVTHDPWEAALLADEMIVLGGGDVLQAGTCREVFRFPASLEVGRLLGIDNVFEGATISGGWLLRPGCRLETGDVASTARSEHSTAPRSGSETDLGRDSSRTKVLWHVPAEALEITADEPPPVHPPSPEPSDMLRLGRGHVEDVIEVGRSTDVLVRFIDGEQIRGRIAGSEVPDIGWPCVVQAPPHTVSIWPVGL
jgi:molybdate transport system permease protein